MVAPGGCDRRTIWEQDHYGCAKKSLDVIDEEVSVGMGSTWRRE